MRTLTKEAVRDTLKEMREAAGISQAELARRMERPASMISRVESGDAEPTMPEAAAWATACGRSLSLERATSAEPPMPADLAAHYFVLSPESMAALARIARRLAVAEREIAVLHGLGEGS